MNLKKFLAATLASAMVLSSMSFSVLAEDTTVDVWDGTADTTWYNDTETEFILTTAEQLAGLAELIGADNTFIGNTVKLGNSVDMSGFDWVVTSKDFSGIFDGQNNTISNLSRTVNVYTSGRMGLFGHIEGGTVKNLEIDGAEFYGYGPYGGIVTGSAYGECVFENITITNSHNEMYNTGSAGIVGLAYSDSNYTFKNISIDDSNIIGSYWGSWDTATGGLIGYFWKNTDNISPILVKDCYIAPVLNVYNDVCASYQWYAYRYAGMLVGYVQTTETVDGTTYPVLDNLTCENVTVEYDTWANYRYCEWEKNGKASYSNDYKFSREDKNNFDSHVHTEEEDHHNIVLAFNQLYGGGQGVYGVKEHEGATIIDNAIVARSVAKIGEDYYETLDAAIDAAQSGETVTLVKDVKLTETVVVAADDVITLDLNGYVLETDETVNDTTSVHVISNEGSLTVTDGVGGGKIVSNDCSTDSNGAKTKNGFAISNTNGGKLVIDGATIEGTNWGYALYVVDEGSTVTIEEGTVINGRGAVYLDGGANGTINGGDFAITVQTTNNQDNVVYVGGTSELVINDGNFDATQVAGSQRVAVASMDASEITINGGTFDSLTGDVQARAAVGSVQIAGGTFKGTGLDERTTDAIQISGGIYAYDPAAYVAESFQEIKGSNTWTIALEADVADKVYVQYRKTDVGTDAEGNEIDTLEGADKYEIVLAGYLDEAINELASADLTFDFNGTLVSGGAMSYTVLPAEGVTLSQIGDRFMFNYDGVTKEEETGSAIVIGTIEINGYGTYTLATDAEASETNAVYATKIIDNIVDGYTAAANLMINEDMVENDGMVGEITTTEIAVPTRELEINITFPNAVVNNKAAYQDMTVTIVGGTVNETIALGTDGENYNFTRDLPYNTAYTVTVEGAGYRTARYTVNLTEDKTLNFWNNVMDNALEVETGMETSAVTKNFLAGDIVKDNNINIYDLSAVVSYFGTDSDTDTASVYAQYDLNRDGVIDSKDVAYVLVSWMN